MIKVIEGNGIFPHARFDDFYNNSCSIQLSSLVREECIWLGVDDAKPMILAKYAKSHGIDTDQNTGWVKYPISSDVKFTTRMHLTREQVKDLLPLLENFAKTGELS